MLAQTSSHPSSRKPLTVLVTGAEGALGSVVAERFLRAGDRVIATYLNEPRAEWKASDRLVPLKMDVTNAVSIRSALARLGGGVIDGWVHCAGGFRFTMSEAFSDEDLGFLMDLNLKSAFLLARELVPAMKKANRGRIVFVGAKATLSPSAGMGLYTATKAGINALTQALADEVKKNDIRVNAVLPSIIDTPANRKDMPNADFSAWVKPAELAEIIFSLTEESSPIHGALIPVAGRV